MGKLRNHHYTFKIKNVSAHGYDDSYTAFISGPVNIEAQVLEWNTADINTDFDGQNILQVSQDEFSFEGFETGQAADNILQVLTDYTTTVEGERSGWYVEKIVDATTSQTIQWLTVSASGGAANDNTEVILGVTENTTGAERSAVVWLAAGRLRYPVKVTQDVPVLYVGYFAGELVADANGVWKFERAMYTQSYDEPTGGLRWSSVTDTETGVNTNVNNGKVNTLGLYNSSSQTVHHANLCVQKNNNYASISSISDENYIWYLPSHNQLIAVWVICKSYHEDYQYASSGYSSSTEISATQFRYVSLQSGHTGSNVKTNSVFVRCVFEK